MRQHGWRLKIKQVIDRGVAGAGLMALSPILMGACAAIWVSDGRPILFRQQRPGRHEKPFTLVKFRTMSEARGRDGELLGDGARLTALGKLLRATSIDELPQLWNVLRGDMSLVGPRPLLMRYLDRYTSEQRRRHEVLPGLTGWAQVRGRNALSWDEKFQLDVWYVDHWSVFLDLRILLETFGAVRAQRGVSAQGHATMPEFFGKQAAPPAP